FGIHRNSADLKSTTKPKFVGVFGSLQAIEAHRFKLAFRCIETLTASCQLRVLTYTRSQLLPLDSGIIAKAFVLFPATPWNFSLESPGESNLEYLSARWHMEIVDRPLNDPIYLRQPRRLRTRKQWISAVGVFEI